MASRREREQRERRHQRAKEWQEREVEDVALPSSYGIRPFTDLDKQEHEQVNVYGRVSTRKQSIGLQLKGIGVTVRNEGILVHDSFGETCSGKLLDRVSRTALHGAVSSCKQQRIPLVCAGFSRLVRAENYHAAHNPEQRPDREKVEEMVKLLDGVRVYTVGHPDDLPPQDEQTLREMLEVARHSKGRPFKPSLTEKQQLRREWAHKAFKMRGRGMKAREIANHISAKEGVQVSEGTVRGWVSSFCE